MLRRGNESQSFMFEFLPNPQHERHCNVTNFYISFAYFHDNLPMTFSDTCHVMSLKKYRCKNFGLAFNCCNLLPRVFMLRCVAGALLVITQQNVCYSMQQIINYRPLMIDQFQFRLEKAAKTRSLRVQLLPPSVCSSRPHQYTDL